MRTIGRTNEGDYLVEMNPDEHRALARLAGIENNDWRSIAPYHTDPSTSSIDLSTPLGAIRHYVRSRARLLELQRLLSDVEDILTADQIVFEDEKDDDR